MKDPRDVVLRPVVSEKSYDLIQDENTYTFVVHPTANKTEIKQAIQKIFDVQVDSVRTINRRGKLKRQGWVTGRRPNVKRALIKLREGNTIDIFEV
ncbi:MAG: 50S ribosomal protein L23 [Acidimicrobiia bacterium]|nr:50S ribosomal protein L23 [Acidimicrobiia bacterium]